LSTPIRNSGTILRVIMLQRYLQNPILKPCKDHSWESWAVFNGSVVKHDEQYHLIYRAMGDKLMYKSHKMRLSTIGQAISVNGVRFEQRKPLIKPKYDWEKYGCEDPRVTEIDGQYLIFYTALSNYPPNALGVKSAVAFSQDLKTISRRYLITPFNAKAMVMFPEKINNLYTVIVTVNPDQPPTSIGLAQFSDLNTLWDLNFWHSWYEDINHHLVKLKRVNNDQPEIGATPIRTEYGWLLIYSYIKHYLNGDVPNEFRIETVLLDLNNPSKIIGRVEQPLLKPEAPYEKQGNVINIVFPEGAIIDKKKLKVYYGAADNYCALASVSLDNLLTKYEINSPATLKCTKFANNPILVAKPEHEWESEAVFNPAAIVINNKVYIVYRTTGNNQISNLGLAISHDGVYIDERLSEPIYPLRGEFEKPRESGKPAGCEDPRLTVIDNTIYMCYTAHDGVLPRLAFTSISAKKFLKRDWNAWTEPKIISPPDIPDKDGILFPEKIKGKYVFIHRIEPNIVLDIVDDLKFENKKYLEIDQMIMPRTGFWDAVKVGINNPPIKTKEGWLLFYHGISQIDNHYRLGALLLELENVTKVIARTPYPILEPEYSYERGGVVNNVVFPCGHVLIDNDIYLYYGGADKVVCGAKINLLDLLNYLLNSQQKKYLQLKKQRVKNH